MTALFDFDGVVMDTEGQYTVFWDRIGKKYLGLDGFGMTIKGQTLKFIMTKFFSLLPEERGKIISELDEFERNISYIPLPGIMDFIMDLKAHAVMTAVVTSSTDTKMQNVYRECPELKNLVDHIYTSEDFSRSKPDPECFLLAMRDFESRPEDTVIFEDSVDGLKAARATDSAVIGLITTNPEPVISPYSDLCIPDFKGMTYDAVRQFLESRKA